MTAERDRKDARYDIAVCLVIEGEFGEEKVLQVTVKNRWAKPGSMLAK